MLPGRITFRGVFPMRCFFGSKLVTDGVFSCRPTLFFAPQTAAILLVALLAIPAMVHAQQPGDAVRAGVRIQQEQQEQQRQQLLEDASRRKEAAPIKMPEVVRPTLGDGGACREIKEIVLVGVTLLSEAQQKSLIAPYLNRCLTASDIENFLGDLVKAYIDRGNIAARPYIRAQDLNAGRLEVLVVEGKVESILLQDGDRKSVNLTTAFPWVIGQQLDLRDIEQGLDQINRLASNSATMEILPGTAPGDSIIGIANNPSMPLWFSPSIDNLGSESTGKTQLGGTLSLDNPLGINDFVSLTHRESQVPDRGLRNSIMDSVYYSVPFGYGLLSLSYNSSSYLTPVVLASGSQLKASGDSESVMAKFDWVAYRDQAQKITESIALTQKTNKNYLEQQLLEVSSRNLTILDLDLLWNRYLDSGTVTLGLGYSKGLDMMGALEDEAGLSSQAPHAQGEKIRYSANLFVPFKVAGYNASFSSQLSGQYARQALYGSEQMLVGSYYTVRGFVRNSLSGDRAYYLRNELGVAIPARPIAEITIKPYLALDYGNVQSFGYTQAGSLTGCAAGVRISSRYLNADVAYVQPLHAPSTMAMESPQILATLSLNF
jgi:hemolysin activation/secretion protein